MLDRTLNSVPRLRLGERDRGLSEELFISAGKSTVAALLERFYEPQEGVVKLDGQALCTLDPSWLRGEVLGYISQEPVLFGCSVMENIRYGNPAATDGQVQEAAALAYADQFIQEFPNGYATLVGERGVALSGGQKQRSGGQSVGDARCRNSGRDVF